MCFFFIYLYDKYVLIALNNILTDRKKIAQPIYELYPKLSAYDYNLDKKKPNYFAFIYMLCTCMVILSADTVCINNFIIPLKINKLSSSSSFLQL